MYCSEQCVMFQSDTKEASMYISSQVAKMRHRKARGS